MRYLHRVARRRPDPCLLDVCYPGARQCHSDCRGARGRRDLASVAARFYGPPRAAMRLLHPGLSDARHRRAGARARYQRRVLARGAGVEPLPLYRVSGHRRSGARGCRRAAPGESLSMDPNPPLGRVLGRSVPRLEDRTLLTGRGQFVGDIAFPRQLHMRVVRSPYAHAALRGVDIAAALAAPGVIAVWTGAEIAELAPLLAADAPSASYASGQSTEALVLHAGYGEVDAAFASAHAVVTLDLTIGRHSGVPIETRGAVPRYDPSRDVVELYGATKVPHRNRD